MSSKNLLLNSFRNGSRTASIRNFNGKIRVIEPNSFPVEVQRNRLEPHSPASRLLKKRGNHRIARDIRTKSISAFEGSHEADGPFVPPPGMIDQCPDMSLSPESGTVRIHGVRPIPQDGALDLNVELALSILIHE